MGHVEYSAVLLLYFYRTGWCRRTLYTCMLQAIGSNSDRGTDYPEFLRGFIQFLQKNFGLVPQLGLVRFHPHPSQFIIQLFDAIYAEVLTAS
jgi:hypothetical protein